MKTNHTPGPWTIKPFKSWDKSIYVEPMVCEVDNDDVDQKEAFANAMLIAAAPDLLEALQACLIRMDEHDEQSAPECLAARAAIAKATTPQPTNT